MSGNKLVDPFDQKAPPPGGLVDPFDTPPPTPKSLSVMGKLGKQYKEMYGDVAAGVKDVFTGDKTREFDLPDLSSSAPPGLSQAQMAKIAGAYVTQPNEAAIADIAAKNVPGSTITKDKFGNLMLDVGDEFSAYINRPGFGLTDVNQFVGEAALLAPAAKYGAAGKSLIKRAFRTGGASSATSVGQDVAGQQMGSEQDVDWTRAGFAGGFGSGFELLSPVAKAAWRKLTRQKKYFDPTSGQLTPKGQEVAKAAGLNPDDLGPEEAAIFAREASRVGPKQAAGIAQRTGGEKEFGVRLTAGQRARDINQLAAEEEARHGLPTAEAGKLMDDFDQNQIADVLHQTDYRQGQLSQGRGVRTPGAEKDELAGIGLEGLRNRAKDLGKGITRAYEKAAERDARFEGTNIRDLVKSVSGGLKRFDISSADHPQTFRALRELNRLNKRVRNTAKNPHAEALNFREFEKTRRRIGNYWSNAKGADKAAAASAKRNLDTWWDDAVDNGLFSGDEDFYKVLKDARFKRAEYGRLYEGKDPGGRVIQKLIAEDAKPEDFANWLFGRSKLGGRQDSSRVAGRLKEIYGADSEEWNVVREMAWKRMTKGLVTGMKGELKLSAKSFKNNYDYLFTENPTLLKTLFNDNEIKLMGRYKDHLMKTTTPDSRTNPSRTAYTIGRMMRFLIRRKATAATFSGDPIQAGILHAIGKTPTGMGSKMASKAIRAERMPKLKSPAFVAPATAGGVLLQDDFR